MGLHVEGRGTVKVQSYVGIREMLTEQKLKPAVALKWCPRRESMSAICHALRKGEEVQESGEDVKE